MAGEGLAERLAGGDVPQPHVWSPPALASSLPSGLNAIVVLSRCLGPMALSAVADGCCLSDPSSLSFDPPSPRRSGSSSPHPQCPPGRRLGLAGKVGQVEPQVASGNPERGCSYVRGAFRMAALQSSGRQRHGRMAHKSHESYDV